MQYRTLGATGCRVSQLALGAGPVADLLTGDDEVTQRDVLAAALGAGINWIDTAATYGEGTSERQLGKALRAISAADRFHLATKVRLMPDQLVDVRAAIRASVAESLGRLGVTQVALLQLHNAITAERGMIPTSVTPDDVLRPGGIADQLEALREARVTRWIGFTGIGDGPSLRAVADSGRFETLQIPFSLANPTAAYAPSMGFAEIDYGQVLDVARQRHMGVFAIRALAGGALAGQPPSAYTYKTRFFPLDLYQRDQQRAERMVELLPSGMSLCEAALRFPLNHDTVSSLIVGLSSVAQLRKTSEFIDRGPLPPELHARLLAAL